MTTEPTVAPDFAPQKYMLAEGGALYLLEHELLYVGPVQDNQMHSHYLMQLVLGLSSSYTLVTPVDRFKSETALCIASEQAHQLTTQQGHIALLFTDPVSKAGIGLKHRCLKNQPVATLQPEVSAFTVLQSLLERKADAVVVSEAVQNFLETILPQAPLPEIDPRIQSILGLLQANTESNLSVAELADKACLSESRLAHLFKAEVGVTVRYYVLWQRLFRAIKSILQGRQNLTEAAHAAGFSDSAHFSRTFKSMIGVTPSAIFKV